MHPRRRRLAEGRKESGAGVHNIGDMTALSIDVYGTDVTRIGSSVRRYYD